MCPLRSLATDRVIYLSAACLGLCSCVFVYLASRALRHAYMAEERSAERKEENDGTTMVQVQNRSEQTGSL